MTSTFTVIKHNFQKNLKKMDLDQKVNLLSAFLEEVKYFTGSY